MKLMDLTANELRVLKHFTELAEEATTASEAISKKFSNSFGIGKSEIPVFHTESFGEYYGDATLTIDAIWKYSDNWGGGNHYEIPCTPNGIFKCYRAYYLKENNLAHLMRELSPEERNLSEVAPYFRKFIEEITAE